MDRDRLRQLNMDASALARDLGLDACAIRLRRACDLRVRWSRMPGEPFSVELPDLMDDAPPGAILALCEELMRSSVTASPFRAPEGLLLYLRDPTFALSRREEVLRRSPHLRPMDWRMEQARFALQQLSLDVDGILFARRTDSLPSRGSRLLRLAMVSRDAPEDPDLLGEEMWRLACRCMAGYGPRAREEEARLLAMHPAFADDADPEGVMG